MLEASLHAFGDCILKLFFDLVLIQACELIQSITLSWLASLQLVDKLDLLDCLSFLLSNTRARVSNLARPLQLGCRRVCDRVRDHVIHLESLGIFTKLAIYVYKALVAS